MGSEILLLAVNISPFTMRVKIAFAEKGVEYESKEEDLINNKSPLLLQMNPVHKQVPVLIHKGKPICESLIIVEYIDETWNDTAPLLPSDPYQRSHARFWADYVDKKIFHIGSKFWRVKGEEIKEEAKKELIEAFKVQEGELGDKPYFGGEKFGFADLALIPYKSFFYTFETLGHFSMEAECPKIVEWANRCTQEKESVTKSLADPNKVFEYVLRVKKKFGVE